MTVKLVSLQRISAIFEIDNDALFRSLVNDSWSCFNSEKKGIEKMSLNRTILSNGIMVENAPIF
jgi:hypothetical protein